MVDENIFDEKGSLEKGIKSPKERLASIASELAREVSGKVDSDFCRDIQKLSKEVQVRGILHSHEQNEKHAFGRQNCWIYASDYLDHHFQQALEFCQMLSEDQTDIRLPSQQLKYDFSFADWHQLVEGAVKKLHFAGLDVVAHKLDAIRLLTSCMNTTSIDGEIRYCRYCFRRVPTKNNCRYHMAVSDDFYVDVKKPMQFLDNDGWKWVVRQRGIRGIIGEYPFNHSYFREAGEIPKLIHQGSWKFASELLQKLFDTELNMVRGVLVIKMYEQEQKPLFPLNLCFSNYVSFVRWIYSKEILDNSYEDSISAFWLINTLFAANERFKAEKKLSEHAEKIQQDTEKRDLEIIRLYEQGTSYRKIAYVLAISKSLVGKVIKSRNN
jgi:hypothetical protein